MPVSLISRVRSSRRQNGHSQLSYGAIVAINYRCVVEHKESGDFQEVQEFVPPEYPSISISEHCVSETRNINMPSGEYFALISTAHLHVFNPIKPKILPPRTYRTASTQLCLNSPSAPSREFDRRATPRPGMAFHCVIPVHYHITMAYVGTKKHLEFSISASRSVLLLSHCGLGGSVSHVKNRIITIRIGVPIHPPSKRESYLGLDLSTCFKTQHLISDIYFMHRWLVRATNRGS
jgi:hypothetical protein